MLQYPSHPSEPNYNNLFMCLVSLHNHCPDDSIELRANKATMLKRSINMLFSEQHIKPTDSDIKKSEKTHFV